MNNKIKAAVLGCTGYTGLELVNILNNHPNVILSFLGSQSHSGEYINKFDKRLKNDSLPKLNLFNNITDFFIWAIILSALMSWLIGFNIVNINTKIVYIIADFLNRLTEPFLSPIRRILPNLGGIDLSPVVLILLLIFVKDLVNNNYYDFINKLN